MMKPFVANGQDIDRPVSACNIGLYIRLKKEKFSYRLKALLHMIIGDNKMGDYRRAKKQIEVSVGESVRIIRELQELSQNELSRRTGIPQSTISAIENDRVQLGVERAKVLAQALMCHPAVLVFPGWEIRQSSAA